MGFNSAFKGLNTELNPICHLLALLGAHHILHVSGIRVKEILRSAHTNVFTHFAWISEKKTKLVSLSGII